MTDYKPSMRLASALADFDAACQAQDAARIKLRGAIAADLRDTGATTDEVSRHTPWSSETLRLIARESGIALKRKPTVQSIKGSTDLVQG